MNPVLLAYEMNGEHLPAHHGQPLRVLVPAWYAVSSVKWLTEIEVSDQPSRGYYQVQRYVYESQTPVSVMRERSLITDPEQGATVDAGELTIQGLAWSGSGPIVRVDPAVGDGDWSEAKSSDSLLATPGRVGGR